MIILVVMFKFNKLHFTAQPYSKTTGMHAVSISCKMINHYSAFSLILGCKSHCLDCLHFHQYLSPQELHRRCKTEEKRKGVKKTGTQSELFALEIGERETDLKPCAVAGVIFAYRCACVCTHEQYWEEKKKGDNNFVVLEKVTS